MPASLPSNPSSPFDRFQLSVRIFDRGKRGGGGVERYSRAKGPGHERFTRSESASLARSSRAAMPREINFNFKLRLAPILGPLLCRATFSLLVARLNHLPRRKRGGRTGEGEKRWCPSFPALLSIHSREHVREIKLTDPVAAVNPLLS